MKVRRRLVWTSLLTIALTASLAFGAQGAGEAFAGAEAKRVGLGVWRITDDGTGYDMGRIRHVAASPDGTIWIAGHNRFSRLGQAGAIKKPFRVKHVYDLAVAPDGDVVVEGVSMASYDGESWTKLWSEPRRPHEYRAIGLAASDGSVWARSASGVERWDGETWARHRGSSYHYYTSAMAETSDGIWTGVAGSAGFEGLGSTGLFRFNATEWSAVRPIADERSEVADLAGSVGGDLWASFLPQDVQQLDRPDYARAHLARWDGEVWTSFAWPLSLQSKLERLPWNAGADGYHPTLSPGMQLAPDGTLWFKKPLMSFDGDTWKRYDIPHAGDNIRPRVEDFAIGPDGRLWLVVRDYTDWHPGEPDGIYVVDPGLIVPTALERAVVRAPTD